MHSLSPGPTAMTCAAVSGDGAMCALSGHLGIVEIISIPHRTVSFVQLPTCHMTCHLAVSSMVPAIAVATCAGDVYVTRLRTERGRWDAIYRGRGATALALFETNTCSWLVIGTMGGSLSVYDLRERRFLCERSIFRSRIDHLSVDHTTSSVVVASDCGQLAVLRLPELAVIVAPTRVEDEAIAGLACVPNAQAVAVLFADGQLKLLRLLERQKQTASVPLESDDRRVLIAASRYWVAAGSKTTGITLFRAQDLTPHVLRCRPASELCGFYFLPDGHRLLCCHVDGVCEVLNAHEDTFEATIGCRVDPLVHVSSSQGSELVVTEAGMVLLLQGGQVTAAAEIPSAAPIADATTVGEGKICLAVSGSGRLVSLQVRHRPTGYRQVGPLQHAQCVSGVHYGDLCIVGCADGTVVIVNPRESKLVRSLCLGSSSVTDVAASCRSDLMAAGTLNGYVHVLTGLGVIKRTWRAAGQAVNHLALDNAGRYVLVVARAEGASLWRAGTGQKCGQLPRSPWRFRQCLGHKDEECVLLADNGALVRVDATCGAANEVACCDDSRPSCVAITADGTHVAVGYQSGRVELRHLGSGRRTGDHSFSEPIVALGGTGSQPTVVTAAGRIYRWIPAKNQRELLAEVGAPVCAAAVKAEGKMAVVVMESRRVCLWSLAGYVVEDRQVPGEPVQVASDESCQVLAVAFRSGRVAARQGPSYRWTRVPQPRGRIRSLAVSPNGSLLCVATAHRLLLWRPREKSVAVVRRLHHHQASIRSVAFLSETALVVTWDYGITWLDARRGEVVKTLAFGPGTVTAASFTEDGCLITGTAEGQLLRWRLDDLRCVAAADVHCGPIRAVDTGPQRGWVTAVTEHGYVVNVDFASSMPRLRVAQLSYHNGNWILRRWPDAGEANHGRR